MSRLLRLSLPLLLACLVLGAVISRAGASPEVGWTAATPLPLPTGIYGTVQCPDNPESFYVLGGMTTGNVAVIGFHRYDVGTDTWTALAPYSQALSAVALACDDGVIYAAGGAVLGVLTTNTFYQYDIAGDSWAMGPTLPRFVQGAGLGVWDGHLYLVGGDNAPAIPLDPETQVDRYDIAAGVWEANWGEPMPEATLATVVQAGPFLYFVGGYTEAHPQNADVALRYDMAHDRWSAGPSFTNQRAAFGLSITGQYLYAAGGDANGGGAWDASPAVEVLDWTAWPDGSWETVLNQLPTAVLGNTAGACTEAMAGGKVWSVGGSVSSGSYVSDALYLAAEPCYQLTYGLALGPEQQNGQGLPGADIVYELTLTNTGSAPDSYAVDVAANWPTVVSPIEPVDPYDSVTVLVTVSVQNAPEDVATITLTSMGDPAQSASATLVTSASALELATVSYQFVMNDGSAGSGVYTLYDNASFADSAGGGGLWGYLAGPPRLRLLHQGSQCNAFSLGFFRGGGVIGGSRLCTNGSGVAGLWRGNLVTGALGE